MIVTRKALQKEIRKLSKDLKDTQEFFIKEVGALSIELQELKDNSTLEEEIRDEIVQ